MVISYTIWVCVRVCACRRKRAERESNISFMAQHDKEGLKREWNDMSVVTDVWYALSDAWASHENNGQTIYISYSHVKSFETLETFQHDDIPIAILSLLLLPEKNTKNYMSIGPEIYSSHVSIDIWGRWWKCNFTLALRHFKSFNC